ncbi:UNKNOWN [Stylonychia lemnae]|uniref:Uncharacterized protein n=1 Tax=Stylonychia lemnae TaxID=5949 RepID=A0A077ZYN6_STYLE|nr:UNKNOWN [Stylonychia lemnae]|eukprot:CDW74297.1 UNKNOWN [Stylonychia lemnae]
MVKSKKEALPAKKQENAKEANKFKDKEVKTNDKSGKRSQSTANKEETKKDLKSKQPVNEKQDKANGKDNKKKQDLSEPKMSRSRSLNAKKDQEIKEVIEEQPKLNKRQSTVSKGSNKQQKNQKVDDVKEEVKSARSRSKSPPVTQKQQKQNQAKPKPNQQKQAIGQKNTVSVDKADVNMEEASIKQTIISKSEEEPMQIDTTIQSSPVKEKVESQIKKTSPQKVEQKGQQAVSINRTQHTRVNMTPNPSNFMEFNKFVSNLLNPISVGQTTTAQQNTFAQPFNQINSGIRGLSGLAQGQRDFNHKFTPRIDKSMLHRSLERGQFNGILGSELGINSHDLALQTAEQLKLKRRTSLDDTFNSHQTMQVKQESNLLEQAKQGGPQKHINRLEALERYGKSKGGPVNGAQNQQVNEKKNLAQMAALGNFVGTRPGQIGFQVPLTKQELLRDKEQKNKKALQENSLVQFAENQPDLYAPITLPFFNQYKQDEQQLIDNEKKKLNRESNNDAIMLEKEKSSVIKLQRTENFKEDGELRDLLMNQYNAQNSQVEPFLIQLPSTLPFNISENPNQQQFNDSTINKSVNQIEKLIERLQLNDKNEEQTPPKIGKIRVMKSGKVVLRMQDPINNDLYVDFELTKGIQTNFYQELISVDLQAQRAHFMAPINHKLIATPDLDSIFQ